MIDYTVDGMTAEELTDILVEQLMESFIEGIKNLTSDRLLAKWPNLTEKQLDIIAFDDDINKEEFASYLFEQNKAREKIYKSIIEMLIDQDDD